MSDDVEERLRRRLAEPRRGTPAGREPAVGHARTRRLIGLTVTLMAASAVVLAVALLVGLG